MPRTRSDVGPSRISRTPRALVKRLSAAAFVLSSATLAFLGCASVLDIDQDYVLESELSTGGSGAAGKVTGGKTGSGGASNGGAIASGGLVGSGGSEAGGGGGDLPDAACVEDGPGCSTGTKCCGGACVVPAPLVGCGATGCEPCGMPPDHGTMVCAGVACAIKCNPHFVLKGTLCEPEPSNTGGAGGVSGGGGSTATGGAAPGCDAKLCPGCGAPGPFGCCKNDDQCGCSWTPSGSGYCL